MAKKKQGSVKDLLITAIKKTVNPNTVLPILEDVYLTGKEAIVSDLETVVIIPYPVQGLKTIDETPGVCVPSKRFIDVMEIMDSPKVEMDLKYDADGNLDVITTAFTEGKRVIKLASENPNNFPKVPMRDEPTTALTTISEADLAIIAEASEFISKDDLRPAMTGVFFSDNIVATDAHRLFWKKPSYPIKNEAHQFIMPPKAIKILLALGSGPWTVTGNIQYEMKNGKVILEHPKTWHERKVECFQIKERWLEGTLTFAKEEFANQKRFVDFDEFCLSRYSQCDPEDTETGYFPDYSLPPIPKVKEFSHVCFEREDGVKIITRRIDARYPDYKVVIPEIKDAKVTLSVNPDSFVKEVSTALKFANKSTKQVVFNMNGKFTIGAQEVDFGEEYSNEIENVAYKFHDDKTNELRIGFNGDFLTHILNKQPKDAPIVFKLWTPTKCTIVNDSYLLMPLMLKD